MADDHARTIVRNILLPWPPKKVDHAVLPWCTFTSPEVARVGLNEAEARHRGIAHDVWTCPFREVDRAIVEREEDGFVKVLTASGGDRILGATVVGERAGDLVHELVLAMKSGVGLSARLRDDPRLPDVRRGRAQGRGPPAEGPAHAAGREGARLALRVAAALRREAG